eukprot:TRINITY_DN24356_c0_g2_i2.p1 TRINITY_DN24356_c0_g2~~TRINITY_DN24356_c0_g2_i2.p1  ORF type:complete len:874 (-),score=129.15 TRINITY_DN24356_c0_g2_i2:326-2947(-)
MTFARTDLDDDGECTYNAYMIAEPSDSLPSRSTWKMWCAGAFQDAEITLAPGPARSGGFVRGGKSAMAELEKASHVQPTTTTTTNFFHFLAASVGLGPLPQKQPAPAKPFSNPLAAMFTPPSHAKAEKQRQEQGVKLGDSLAAVLGNHAGRRLHGVNSASSEARRLPGLLQRRLSEATTHEPTTVSTHRRTSPPTRAEMDAGSTPAAKTTAAKNETTGPTTSGTHKRSSTTTAATRTTVMTRAAKTTAAAMHQSTREPTTSSTHQRSSTTTHAERDAVSTPAAKTMSAEHKTTHGSTTSGTHLTTTAATRNTVMTRAAKTATAAMHQSTGEPTTSSTHQRSLTTSRAERDAVSTPAAKTAAAEHQATHGPTTSGTHPTTTAATRNTVMTRAAKTTTAMHESTHQPAANNNHQRSSATTLLTSNTMSTRAARTTAALQQSTQEPTTSHTHQRTSTTTPASSNTVFASAAMTTSTAMHSKTTTGKVVREHAEPNDGKRPDSGAEDNNRLFSSFAQSKLDGWRYAEKAIIATLIAHTNLVLHFRNIHLEIAGAFQAITLDSFKDKVDHPMLRFLEPFIHRNVQATKLQLDVLLRHQAAEFGLAPLPVETQLQLLQDLSEEQPLNLADLDMEVYGRSMGLGGQTEGRDVTGWKSAWLERASEAQQLLQTFLECWLGEAYDEVTDEALQKDAHLAEWWSALVTRMPALKRAMVETPSWAGKSGPYVLTVGGLKAVLRTILVWVSWMHEDFGHSMAAFVYNPVYTPMFLPKDGVGVPLFPLLKAVSYHRNFVFLERPKLMDEFPGQHGSYYHTGCDGAWPFQFCRRFHIKHSVGHQCILQLHKSLSKMKWVRRDEKGVPNCDEHGFFSCPNRVESSASS